MTAHPASTNKTFMPDLTTYGMTTTKATPGGE
jgi:hypothetical protein